jgi:DNA polymerase III delta prime subunit
MELKDVHNSIWVERYRPQHIHDIILPERIKSIFVNLLAKKEIPNLLLTGGAGCGKTTIAKVFAEEIGANTLFINASFERGIDTLRNRVEDFVSTCSLNSDVPKVVIFDEIDHMSTNAVMALRGFIEIFSSNARFFLTCNNANRLIDPMHSRMQTIVFNWSNEEKKLLMKEFGRRLLFILDREHIKIDGEAGKKALSEFVKKLFPDMRKIIGEIQLFSNIDGMINEGLLYMLDEKQFEDLYKVMKEKNYTKCREWVTNHISSNSDPFYQQIFKDLDKIFVDESIPEAVTILDEHQCREGFLKDLTVMSCLTFLMTQCKFR